MPVYDFKCRGCSKEFTVTAPVSRIEKGKAVKCPECGRKNAETDSSPFSRPGPQERAEGPFSLITTLFSESETETISAS